MLAHEGLGLGDGASAADAHRLPAGRLLQEGFHECGDRGVVLHVEQVDPDRGDPLQARAEERARRALADRAVDRLDQLVRSNRLAEEVEDALPQGTHDRLELGRPRVDQGDEAGISGPRGADELQPGRWAHPVIGDEDVDPATIEAPGNGRGISLRFDMEAGIAEQPCDGAKATRIIINDEDADLTSGHRPQV